MSGGSDIGTAVRRSCGRRPAADRRGGRARYWAVSVPRNA
jgi:hypothetical protein